MAYQTYDDYRINDSEQHPCARGNHCAARTVVIDSGERIIQPALTYRTYCDADTDRIKDCLIELPNLYEQLEAEIGDRQQRAPTERVSEGGVGGSHILVNERTDDFLRVVTRVTVSWEERVRDVAPLSEMRSHLSINDRSHRAVRIACNDVLSKYVNVLLGLTPAAMYRTCDLAQLERVATDATGWVFPAAGWAGFNRDLGGVEAGVEVLNLHHQFLARLGLTPKHHDLRSACWECNEVRVLRRWDGSAGLVDYVVCLKCGYQYLGAQLRLLMVAEDELLHAGAKKAVA